MRLAHWILPWQWKPSVNMGVQYIYANAVIKWQNTKWDLAVCGAICMWMLLGMDFHLGPGGCLGSGDWCHHILQIHWLHTTQLYCFLETGSRQQREAVVSLWGLLGSVLDSLAFVLWPGLEMFHSNLYLHGHRPSAGWESLSWLKMWVIMN